MVTADHYTPQRATGLKRTDIMDYYLDRLSTLNPRLKNTELYTAINSRLQTIRAIAAESGDRPPTEQDVRRMRDLAIEINDAVSARVDDNGQIIKSN